MKENENKKVLVTIKRLMSYIYGISPRYFIYDLVFTISIGFTSAMSIWATKLLINGIVEISTNKDNNFVRILTVYAAINILIQLIGALNNYINTKHQLKIN